MAAGPCWPGLVAAGPCWPGLVAAGPCWPGLVAAGPCWPGLGLVVWVVPQLWVGWFVSSAGPQLQSLSVELTSAASADAFSSPPLSGDAWPAPAWVKNIYLSKEQSVQTGSWSCDFDMWTNQTGSILPRQ